MFIENNASGGGVNRLFGRIIMDTVIQNLLPQKLRL